MSDARFVVTRPVPGSGLGANLLSMVGALYLAERSGRHLIVDWTNMDALRDKRANYFVTFFEPIRRWRDVEVFYVNDEASGPAACYDAERVVRFPGAAMPDALAGALEASHLYLDAYHYHRVFDHCPQMTPSGLFHYTRAFYRALRPRPEIVARLDVARTRFVDHVVLGLNMRTGNGHPTYQVGGIYATRSGQASAERPDFLRRVAAACHDCLAGLPRELWPSVAIYVVTDDQAMQQRLLELPNAFASRTLFPPHGVGHAVPANGRTETYPDVEIVYQTIVDMFLLAECAGLVYNYSEYNRYPRYVTTFYGGNHRQLEHYFEHPVRSVGRRIVRWARHRRARPWP